MPELPEVETITRELKESDLIGKLIVDVKVLWDRTISSPNIPDFTEQIKQETITDILRRGKYIIFKLSKGDLIVHLRMTGKFAIAKADEPIRKHERVRLILKNGRALIYEDQRKFGRWAWSKKGQDHFHNVGIEPLSEEFTLQFFDKILRSVSQQIKPFLLNQKYIAGLGNIYVDEALWEAKIHPMRLTNSLSKREIADLHTSIPKVLLKGIEHQGTSLGSSTSNYFSVSGRRGGNQYKLNVFRREELPCPRCGNTIIKLRVATRGTHICPHCQPLRGENGKR